MSIKRRTKSLNAILAVFEESQEALSVVDLVERFHDKMNKTTVYRILERLEDEGLIHSFTGTNGLKWYAKDHICEARNSHDIHPHFECNKCGKVECLEVDIPMPKINNRHIESADVLFTGQCADCMD